MNDLVKDTNSEDKSKDKIINKYKCPWCNHKFNQAVGSSGAGHKKVSSQVICKKCGHFISTW